jgi:hypothetical protein
MNNGKTFHGHKRFLLNVVIGFLILILSHTTSYASLLEWSGMPIAGEDPSFTPYIFAEFEVKTVDSKEFLELTLTNNSMMIDEIGQVLTGLTWDISDPYVVLNPLWANLSNSMLVGVGATSDTDLSSEWGYRDDIDAGSSVLGVLGPYGIGTTGEINNRDGFGSKDRFDTSTNLFGPPSGALNGVDAGIVGPFVDLTNDGFTSQGPFVQGNPGGPGAMIFMFEISGGNLLPSEIVGVQPIFGTDGAVLTPEPGTVLLLGTGLLGFAVARIRKKFKK